MQYIDSDRQQAVLQKYQNLKATAAERDVRHHDVAAIRRGDAEAIMPGFFPTAWPKQVVANTIDLASTDLGEMVGVLPTLSCRASRSTVRSAIAAAEKRTKIVNGYVKKSKLAKRLPGGADRYFSFGFMPLVVEPDLDLACPTIRIDDPQGAYYELDFFGNTKCYFKRWYETVESLKAKFPDLKGTLERHTYEGGQHLEVVKYYGPDYTAVMCPEMGGAGLLVSAPNRMGQVPVFIAERPQWDDEVRGQFDQALFVQLARARMSLHMLDVADEAVNAPTIVPKDLLKLPFGPKALWRTENPAGAGKLKIEIPPQVFAENEKLLQEERIAARYPEGRTGNIDASVITGEGVDALLGTMSSQIRTAQDQIRDALAEALSFALRMDVEFWPEVEKTAEGYYEGKDFSERYVPGRDIAGQYDVQATYGMMSGMDPARALVSLLQMRGDKLVSRAHVRRHLPEGLDGLELEAEVDIEDFGDAMKQAVFGLAARAAGDPMADPKMILGQIARMMDLRRKGKPVDEAVLKALEPTEEEKAAAQEAAAQQAAANPLGAALSEAGAVTPGASPGGNEGMGSVQQLLAGLTSAGEPQLSSRVARTLPA